MMDAWCKCPTIKDGSVAQIKSHWSSPYKEATTYKQYL